MLKPPGPGFARSVTVHNVRLGPLADWIEACVVFDDSPLSLIDIADDLVGEYYDEQDFAKERIGDAFVELRRRERCLGRACPYHVGKSTVARNKKWKASAAFSFCLMLSMQAAYHDRFTGMMAGGFNEQGLLFEQLTNAALAGSGWHSQAAGWSMSESASLPEKVEAVSAHLAEPSRPDEVRKWASERARDGGLDIVCRADFPDGWSGRPVLYVQCASGENWASKRHEPDLDLWDKFLDLATRPRRGMAIPFALMREEFFRAVNSEAMFLFLDRNRLVGDVGKAKGWLSRDLVKRLNAWTASRLPALLSARA